MLPIAFSAMKRVMFCAQLSISISYLLLHGNNIRQSVKWCLHQAWCIRTAELPGMVALVSMVSTRYTCRTYSLLLRAPPLFYLSDDDEKEENRFYRLTRTFINLLNYVLISYWYVMNLTPDTKFYAPILLYWHVLNLDEANNSTDID